MGGLAFLMIVVSLAGRWAPAGIPGHDQIEAVLL